MIALHPSPEAIADGIYINGKRAICIEWIWSIESGRFAELSVHLARRTSEEVDEAADLMICTNGGRVKLSRCVLQSRTQGEESYWQVYRGIATDEG